MPKKKPQTKTISFWMALLAIVISLIGTGVSMMEAGILRNQQKLMVEEKAASVWPYVVSSTSVVRTDKGIEVEVVLTNKGVGPALLSPVTFSAAGKQGSVAQLLPIISKNHPGLVLLAMFTKGSSKEVLAAGEEIIVSTILIIDSAKETLPGTTEDTAIGSINMNLLNKTTKIIDAITFDFCYCSIYGDCWDVDNQPLTTNEACSGVEILHKPE
ncbi:MAG: hypothetical protein ACI9G6_001045 [Limisphaerales bacterium]|jgi:hypothetical protein